MPRIARLVVPHYPHHVTQRGNRRQQSFFSPCDYQAYLDLLAAQLALNKVDLWAYCLMPNHVHLILVPRSLDGLARVMRETHARYARRVNLKHEWCGHLWQERFHSFVMDDFHLIAAARYVELNPVRAGLCQHADAWPWSSARAHLHGRNDRILSDKPLRELIPDWKAYLAEKVPNEQVRAINRHSASGRPAGDSRFIERLELLTGRSLKLARPRSTVNRQESLSPNQR